MSPDAHANLARVRPASDCRDAARFAGSGSPTARRSRGLRALAFGHLARVRARAGWRRVEIVWRGGGALLIVAGVLAWAPGVASADLIGGLTPGLGGLGVPALPGGSQPVTPAPAPDPLAFNQALHLTPPLGQRSGVTDIADTALGSQLTVDICRLAVGGCQQVTRLVPTASPLDKLYHATWQSWQAGAKTGDVFKFTFRAARLSIGSAVLKASDLLQSQQVGNFYAGLPVSIDFWVDRVPVIRTRALHDLGASSVDVGQMLHNEFNLGDSDALTAVYKDVRTQDILQSPQPPVASASTLTPPFSLGQVTDSVASVTSYGDTARRAAEVLKARTPLGNQSVVNALVASSALRGLLSPGGLLTIIKDTLGVTDRIPGLNLLKNSQTDDGSPAFDASGVLRAIVEIANGPTNAVAALQQLADVGFPADTAMLAIKSVNDSERAAGRPGLLPLGPGDAIATLAAAGLQTTEFNGVDIAKGLAAVFGGSQDGYKPAILTAANGLVDGSCADYTKALQVGSVADLLRTKTDVVGPADIVKQLEHGRCAFDVNKAAAALHYAYFSSITKPVDEMTAIGQSLINAAPTTPVTDVLLGLVSTLKDQVGAPADTFSCVASVGAIKGALASGLTGAALQPFSLAQVVGNLDAPQLSSLIVNPFGTGAGGPLDQLGRCLVGNGEIPPLPLNRVTIEFRGLSVPAASPCCGAAGVKGELLVGRAGWTPNLAAVVPGRLGKLLDAVKVPSVGALGALTGTLGSLTTLPVLVAGGPGHDLTNGFGCSNTALFTGPDYIHQWPFGGSKTGCPARGRPRDSLLKILGSDQPGVFTDGTINGVPAAPISFVSGLAGGAALTSNGIATFLVPALPGKVTIEGTLYGNNNLSCLSASPNPALYAAAIALPSSVYSALANGAGTRDIWATTGTSKNIDGSIPTASQTTTFHTNFQVNDGRCSARTIRENHIEGDDETVSYNSNSPGGTTGMEGTITVSKVGTASTIAQVTAIANSIAGDLTVRNADPGDGSGDLGFSPTTGGTLAGTNGLIPGDIDGNFLSMLGALGGQAPLGSQLIPLLTTRGPI